MQRWWYLREECGHQSTAWRGGVPSLGWKQPHPSIPGARGEVEPGHPCWTLGEGRWQPPYLPVDLDAAGPEGGGPIACHEIVSRGLCWWLLQLPGHCGDGETPSAPPLPQTLIPPAPERCCCKPRSIGLTFGQKQLSTKAVPTGSTGFNVFLRPVEGEVPRRRSRSCPQHYPWKMMPRWWKRLPLSTLTCGPTVGGMAAAFPGA